MMFNTLKFPFYKKKRNPVTSFENPAKIKGKYSQGSLINGCETMPLGEVYYLK